MENLILEIAVALPDSSGRPSITRIVAEGIVYIHWCAKIKDEVEKLAYQLNEEAEWTERPIRRLSKARRNRRQTAGEVTRHTTQATGRPISRFTVARRLHGGGLFARRPIRCVLPLTPAHRRGVLCGAGNTEIGGRNEWGRVLFTDQSRFSLSSDSHHILIWRERRSRNHPSNIIRKGQVWSRGVLVWEASCLVVIQTFTSSTQVQSTGPVNVTRFFFNMCVFLEALWLCSSFSWTTMHHVIAQ
ncbi:transposable element Tcb1 transposase [Trichonephila clavipes]|nr:transposable element Tcb1 transposase [Trichonephila clavipes]